MTDINNEVKYVEEHYDNTEIVGNEVYVHDFEDDETVSDFGYMFWWNPENEECGIEYQKIPGNEQHDEPCKTAEDFIDYIESRI